MLIVRNLNLSQGRFSLKDINLIVEEGTIHALIGPTGCGKTTLLEAILGLRKIAAGEILLNGQDITKKPPYERGFAYVPQDLAIFPHMTAEENILFGIKYAHKIKEKPQRETIQELIKFLQIEDVLSKKAHLLSGGEKQRVALARALAPGYRYLLLDEPFTALHHGIRREIWSLVRELQRRYGLTIILVSHDLEETLYLADYITVIFEGRIVQSGIKEVVYNEPATIEIARYFGIKNIFRGKVLAKEGNHYKIWCYDLGREIVIPSGKFKGASAKEVTFAIRKEDIMILRPDLPVKGENLLEGKIEEIDFLGGVYLVKFKPVESSCTLELSLPEYAHKKLRLHKEDLVTVSLRSEKISILE